MRIKCISLWEPYASAIALGLKKIETRKRLTHYRGLLGIHAAKRWTWAERLFLGAAIHKFPKVNEAFGNKYDMPLGKVVAVVNLTDCQPMGIVVAGLSEMERFFGDYRPGRFMWRLEDVRRLEVPVAAVGRQGFFEVEIPEL